VLLLFTVEPHLFRALGVSRKKGLARLRGGDTRTSREFNVSKGKYRIRPNASNSRIGVDRSSSSSQQFDRFAAVDFDAIPYRTGPEGSEPHSVRVSPIPVLGILPPRRGLRDVYALGNYMLIFICRSTSGLKLYSSPTYGLRVFSSFTHPFQTVQLSHVHHIICMYLRYHTKPLSARRGK
jgi:hypothetical protein